MRTKRKLRERIADLEARNETLLQQWTEIRDERDSWKWSAKTTAQQLGNEQRKQQARLNRVLRACARYRTELAQQQRVNNRLSEQLMGAMGYGPTPARPRPATRARAGTRTDRRPLRGLPHM